MLIRAWYVLQAAHTQAFLSSLTALEPRHRMLIVSGPEILLVTKAEVFNRPQLEPSKALHSQVRARDQCVHETLLPRGGKTYWWTCRWCGTRWPGETLDLE